MLIVIYSSVYGHTQAYAEAFAQVFNQEALPYKAMKNLDDNDFIVFFAPIYAGGIRDLSSQQVLLKILSH